MTGELGQDDMESLVPEFSPNKPMLNAIQLLMESRECIAACFRTIAASSDKMIMDRLEMELELAGVKNGIGVRLQDFIAATSKHFANTEPRPVSTSLAVAKRVKASKGLETDGHKPLMRNRTGHVVPSATGSTASDTL